MSSQHQDPQTVVEEAQEPTLYRNSGAVEMTEQEFQQWRHNPITRNFLLFLAHRSQAFRATAADYYVASKVLEADIGGLRGRIMELEELCTLKVSDIHRFYGKFP